MIDLPPINHTRSTESREQLAAAIAEMLAVVYQYAQGELAKLPDDPANEHLLDRIFDAVVEMEEASGRTGGPIVREVLGS